MQLHDQLRSLRLARGLTQRQLADTLGIARTHVTQIEGGIRNPSLDVLRAWLEATGGAMSVYAPGGDGDPHRELSVFERSLIEASRQELTEEDRRAVWRLMRLWPAMAAQNRLTLEALFTAWEASSPPASTYGEGLGLVNDQPLPRYPR